MTAEDASGDWLLDERDDSIRVLVLDGVKPPAQTDEVEGAGAWRLLVWTVDGGEYPVIGLDAPEVLRLDTASVLADVGPQHDEWTRSQLTRLLRRLQRSLAGEGAAIPDDNIAAHLNEVHAELVEELEAAWPDGDWRMPVPSWIADELLDEHDELLALMPPGRTVAVAGPGCDQVAGSEGASLRGLVGQIVRELRRRIGTSAASDGARLASRDTSVVDDQLSARPSKAA